MLPSFSLTPSLDILGGDLWIGQTTRDRMKILLVYSTRYPVVRGGVDTMIVTLIDRLRKAHDVFLFTAGSWEERDLAVSKLNGVKLFCKRLRNPYYANFSLRNLVAWVFEFPITFWQITRLIQREGIEIIHLHTLQVYQIYFLLIRVLGGPPYIVTLHRAEVLVYSQRHWVTRLIWRAILRNATRINAVSCWLADKAYEAFPFIEHVDVVLNGVDSDESLSTLLTESKTALKDALPESYFAMIGVVEAYKAQDVAIEAWGRLIQENPNVHLVMAGKLGEHSNYCEKLIQSLNLADRVHMVGAMGRSEVIEIMSHAIGMIFTSRNEGFGLVLVEAGLLKLPTICSDIPPLREIAVGADGEESVLFVPPENPDALARSVTRLIHDDKLRDRLGQALYDRAITEFTAEIMTNGYLRLYRDVL